MRTLKITLSMSQFGGYMETLEHPACTVGWVARLCRSWLSPGGGGKQPEFLMREIPMGQYSCKMMLLQSVHLELQTCSLRWRLYFCSCKSRSFAATNLTLQRPKQKQKTTKKPLVFAAAIFQVVDLRLQKWLAASGPQVCSINLHLQKESCRCKLHICSCKHGLWSDKCLRPQVSTCRWQWLMRYCLILLETAAKQNYHQQYKIRFSRKEFKDFVVTNSDPSS